MDDIQRAYQAAAEWADTDPNAARAADAIEQRYRATDGQEAGSDRRAAAVADQKSARWDTRARRKDAAEALSEAAAEVGVTGEVASEAIEARMLVDVSQAEPVRAAVTSVSRAVGPRPKTAHRVQERRRERSR